MSKTNFEAIATDAQGLGRFLRSLPIIEAPWDMEFQKRYCSGCGAENCDASIPFPDPDACAGTGRNGVHTGRGGG